MALIDHSLGQKTTLNQHSNRQIFDEGLIRALINSQQRL